jgi:hypothetical protein
MQNVIKLELKGVSSMEIERYCKLIQIVIASGGFDVKNGQTILHWKDGVLQAVELNYYPYRRKGLDKEAGDNL